MADWKMKGIIVLGNVRIPNPFIMIYLDLLNLKVGKFVIEEEIFCVPPDMVMASCPLFESMIAGIHKWSMQDLCGTTENGNPTIHTT